jgi:glycerophosphoryl diester phosphodiesterase
VPACKGSDQEFRPQYWNLLPFASPRSEWLVVSPPMPPRPLVLAHQGASRRAAGNTIDAFRHARELGADGVELDVRRTVDDVAVVHHDSEVAGHGLIRSATFAALHAARPEIPTLVEALDATAGMLVNIELKCLPWEPDPDPEHELARHVVELVCAREGTSDVVVSSFDLGAVDACRRVAPELPTGWLTHSQDVATCAPLAVEHGHQWLHPDRATVLASPVAAVVACHARGLRVDVWTVDDPAEMKELASAGVDALITNVPDVALAVLEE